MSFLFKVKDFEFILPLGKVQWDDIVAVALVLAVSAILFHDSPLYNRNPSEKVMYECPQGTGTKRSAEKSDINQVLSREAKDIVIFYGTQSGTSLQLAERLSRDILARFSKPVLVADFSDYECSGIANILPDKLAIFLLSTYGEGDPSDNAAKFAEWIQNIPKSNILQNLRFAILGLGNSNYRFYNKFALRTRQQFHDLGAKELISIQLADDGKGETQETFLSWKTQLFQAFVEDLGIQERPRAYEPLLRLSPSEAEVDPIQMYRPITQLKASKATDSLVFPATVSHIHNITPNASRTTFHVDLDISKEPKLKYAVGDHLMVWPVNAAFEIDELRKVLGVSEAELHQPIAIDRIDSDTPLSWTTPVTLHAIFERHLDVSCLISRDLILSLKQFTESQSCKNALDDLASNYKAQCATQRMTLSSVLRFVNPSSTWKIPTSFLLESFTVIKPRHYSIASTPVITPRMISFTIAVKHIGLSSGQELLGLMSNSLHDMHHENQISPQKTPVIWCNVRKSGFKPPISPMTPMIMVANGSGIAPFLGFLRHRRRTYQLKGDIGHMMLIYGCQDETMHLYKPEIEDIRDTLSGRLQVITSYSRKGEGYVQDQIKSKGPELSRLLFDEKAHLYLCGSVIMSRAVRTNILELFEERGDTKQKARSFEESQMRTKKWQFDVWG